MTCRPTRSPTGQYALTCARNRQRGACIEIVAEPVEDLETPGARRAEPYASLATIEWATEQKVVLSRFAGRIWGRRARQPQDVCSSKLRSTVGLSSQTAAPPEVLCRVDDLRDPSSAS